jgi:GNAT superfamily N-acetyltransferase
MTTSTSHQLIDGCPVTLREIHPADQRMEGDFVRNLSAQTKHYRFLGGVRELSSAELKRLCTVDGDRTMAFVATVQKDGHEVEIGVSRYVEGSKDDAREIAVTVADQWQHKGVGRLLVERLVEYAKARGVKHLYSVDLADNAAMRALAGDLGMSVKSDPDDAHQVIYGLSL